MQTELFWYIERESYLLEELGSTPTERIMSLLITGVIPSEDRSNKQLFLTVWHLSSKSHYTPSLYPQVHLVRHFGLSDSACFHWTDSTACSC